VKPKATLVTCKETISVGRNLERNQISNELAHIINYLKARYKLAKTYLQ